EYYVSRAIASQGYRGKDTENRDWNFSLIPVVGIFICNFKVNGLEEDPVTYGGICNLRNGKPIGHSQCYVYIQLPCFRKEELECESLLDKWIYNIKNMGAAQRVAFKSDNEIFNYLDSVGSVAALDPKERHYYEAALKYSRDYNAVLATAREKAEAQGRAEGLAEGRAEGRAEGLAEGRAEGKAEGLAEGLAEGRNEEKYRIAAEMLNNGMDPKVISTITKLSIDEIERMR
ncbi:MAG: PD-(D/E)XK nuclease family transposase, partial [Muribaculaceae bacterium]|nr:PD-(D/E)XK nuclease family transposase [Muribaculaceae bacterium]